jgi:hypothetical protein
VYKKNEAMLLVKRMKREKDMIAIKDVFVTAMADASAIIVRKLQSELEKGKYVTLARALGGIIKVRATGEMIEDSLINNSLTGVREVLYDKYIKNTFVSVLGIMVNAWTRRITPREADKKPWELLDEVEGLVSVWNQRKMWATITEDVWFTFILIMGLPGASEFRKSLLDKVTDKIKKDADDGRPQL